MTGIIGEILVRMFKYKPFNEMTFFQFRQSDPVLDHSFIPNSRGRLGSKEYRTVYKINSLGFRDYEYNAKKPLGTKRILVLGDSFVEGYGVNIDDTFVKILEKKLNKDGGHKYEVINCGMLSYSPILEYLQLKQKGLALSPDLVVLFLDQSDIQDDYVYAKHAVFDEKGRILAVSHSGFFVGRPKYSRIFIDRFLSSHSGFYVYLKQRIRKLHGKKDKRIDDTITFGDIESDRLFFARKNPKDFQKHWGDTAFYLSQINNLLKENGIDFLIVTYPYAHQIDPYEWSSRTSWGLEVGLTYPKGVYFEAAEKLCGLEKIKYLDLYGAFKNFKEENKNAKLFYSIDGHWTKESHKLVAEKLYNELIKG